LEAFPGRSFYQNAGATRRYGIELAGAFQWKRWDIQASLTQAQYQFKAQDAAEAVDKKSLPGIPNSQAFLQLLYTSPTDWNWMLSGEQLGRFYANNSNSVVIQSFQKVRFQAQKTVQVLWGELHVLGGINNLLNATYFDNIRLNAFGGRYYEPAPGRNFYLGLQFNL